MISPSISPHEEQHQKPEPILDPPRQSKNGAYVHQPHSPIKCKGHRRAHQCLLNWRRGPLQYGRNPEEYHRGANILSYVKVKDRHKITYDDMRDIFTVHTPYKRIHFRRSKGGIYYHNCKPNGKKREATFMQTVQENK